MFTLTSYKYSNRYTVHVGTILPRLLYKKPFMVIHPQFAQGSKFKGFKTADVV